MSVPRPALDERAREALDAIDQPVSVATAVRDRSGLLLDFRLLHVNIAAARWAGLPVASMVGRLLTDVIPVMRPSGLFDVLARVVSTGQPFHQAGQHYQGSVEDGRSFSARFELRAIRVGDGYLSAWTEMSDGVRTDLGEILDRARAAVP
ncbi:MAG TPA: PAS domain-containing protein [Candidatus Limnocylindrales bacterium]|nr:PAS domain-containing protein [Candidatus Limnocylindrales bacterium]